MLITTTDYTLKVPRIFENINLKPEQDVKLVDLGLYTSAAPTYFEPQEYPWKMLGYDVKTAQFNEKLLLMSALQDEVMQKSAGKRKASVLFDGGVLENIPFMSVYTTLHSEYGARPEDIDMFCIGTRRLPGGREPHYR